MRRRTTLRDVLLAASLCVASPLSAVEKPATPGASPPKAPIARPRTSAADTPIAVELNYLARPRHGASAAPAPSGPAITVEVNYIARATGIGGAPAAGAPAGPPVAVEVNYIARNRHASTPPPAPAGAGATMAPVTVENNFIARPIRR